MYVYILMVGRSAVREMRRATEHTSERWRVALKKSAVAEGCELCASVRWAPCSPDLCDESYKLIKESLVKYS